MRLLSRIAALLLISSPLLAQTPAPEARVYTPADFVQFAPRTAYDMLTRVPGFSIRVEDEERGFGEATGNVVINGQRISGKSNDVVTELTRVPAGNVERIEIVDGATLKIPGLAGKVANVIVKSGGIKGQWAYRPEFRSYYTDPLLTRFEISVGGTKGPIEYTVGFDNSGNRSGAGGPTYIYNSAGERTELRLEEWRGNSEAPRLSSRIVYKPSAESTGNLNLLYRRVTYDYLETGTRTTTSDGISRDREVTADEHGRNYEVGADYEFRAGIGRLKVIAVGRGSRFPYEENEAVVGPPTESPTGARYMQVGDENELIARSEYRWNHGPSEWQVSAEGAFNSLDFTSALWELNTAGVMEEVELEGGEGKVDEDRYEIIGSYGRPFTPAVTMKFSAGGEYSKLVQVGAGGTTRTFYRPKGELSAAWKVSPRTDLNFSLARRVGQLNFFDFLASVNLNDDVTRDANPDLVPEQSWDLGVEMARNLGTLGSTTLRLYGRLVDDIIDYIPVGEDGETRGNLDEATIYGFDWRGTFNLDGTGFTGARLDGEATVQDSRVEDPLTGETRQISNSLLYYASLALRHDVPRSSWAWGGGAEYAYNALNYRLTEVGRQWEGPVWLNLFLENKDVAGMTVRGGISNLLAADSMWDRTVYAGRRTDPIDYIERRDRQIGPVYFFAVRGKF